MSSQTWEIAKTTKLIDSYDEEIDGKLKDLWEVWHVPSKKRLDTFESEDLAKRIVHRLETEEFPIPWDKIRDPVDAEKNKDQARDIIREEAKIG